MAAAPITPQDFSEIRWRGHWVWVPEEPVEFGGPLGFGAGASEEETHGLFRKTFRLGAVPDRVPGRLTADSRYALYVNGHEVFRGPVRSQPRRLHYDLFDLAPYLRAGDNILALYVTYYGTPKAYWMPAAPNMTLGKGGVAVFEADLGELGWLVSDDSWKARKATAWSSDWGADKDNPIGGGIPIEVFDARQFPHRWREQAFDDSDWGSAHTVPAMHIGGFARTQPPTDPYGPLYPRPIAKLDGGVREPRALRVERPEGAVDTDQGSPVKRIAATLDRPLTESPRAATLPVTVALAAGNSARLVIDMGGIVSGLVGFSVDAPAGTVLEFAYHEEPATASENILGMHAGTRYIARGEDDSFEVFDSNGFRFAYVLVHGVVGEVTLRSFFVRELLYPWEPGADFSCADDELNRLYRAGIRTVQLNSHDAFLDCPTREQRAWVGDGVVHQLVHLATNSDWRLAWRFLSLGNSPRSDGMLPMSVVGEIESSGGYTIPDWALHWIHGVYNRYLFDGDRDAVKELLPTAERVLRWYVPYQTSRGVLKDVVEWNLVDWSSVSTEDTSALLTGLWARGLREFAEMADWLEEQGSKKWAVALYEKVKAGFDVFWDEARGIYVDHVKNGVRQPETSQLASAVAIVAEVAPAERWHRIVDAITDPDRLVVRSWIGGAGEYSFEKMQNQLRGVYEYDWDTDRQIVLAQPFMSYVVHDAVALAGRAELLPDLYPRWHAFLADGYDTIGECWGWGTHVHGWSCTPTRDLVFYTLGVTPAAPGYAKARIAPRLGRLSWARGTVPTPHGPIRVSVESGLLTIDSPVPVIVDLKDQRARDLPAGKHELPR